MLCYLDDKSRKGGEIVESNSIYGVGLLQLEILHLISLGKKENLKEIELQMENGLLIEYLCKKYRKDISDSYLRRYNTRALNMFFQNYAGSLSDDAMSKYGLANEDDGLLLIIALIANKISEESHNWKI